MSKSKTFVETIEPSAEALSIERIVKLLSTAFEQVCALNEVDKLVLERFRIIFQAAKDYGPMLARIPRATAGGEEEVYGVSTGRERSRTHDLTAERAAVLSSRQFSCF